MELKISNFSFIVYVFCTPFGINNNDSMPGRAQGTGTGKLGLGWVLGLLLISSCHFEKNCDLSGLYYKLPFQKEYLVIYLPIGGVIPNCITKTKSEKQSFQETLMDSIEFCSFVGRFKG